MKHSLKVTLILVLVFFIAQVVGLLITQEYLGEKIVNAETGQITYEYKELPMQIERPQVEESQSYIYIVIAILIGTAVVLLLVKFRSFKVWKFWYLLSVFLCISVAFAAFLPQLLAGALGLLVALWKTYKPNFFVHNLSEIFIYGGLAAIFVPIMNLFSAVILLFAISIYDMIAVWQSKHMVKMAKFQTESKVFAGISIPYQLTKMPKKTTEKKATKKKTTKKEKTGIKTAILGGGDIGFPLLFAGVLLKQYTFFKVLVVPLVVTAALFLLLYYAKKDRFYPAMPFVSIGCFIGFGIMLLL